MSRPVTESKRSRSAAPVDDRRGPDSPTELTKASWVYVVRKTLREFSRDQCTDLAAALTYYAVLALFPAAIALLSLVGLVGQGPKTVDTLMNIVSSAGGSSVAGTLRPTLETLSHTPAAGAGLFLGLLGALWSASGYVGAFGRAMNRMYEIGEGRPLWKLRPVMLLVTLVVVVLAAVAMLTLIVSGPLVQSVGDALGLGSAAVTAWRIVQWPALLLIVILIVATLYYATPNVKQAKFRWLSVGAVVAIILWALLTAGFGFYVASFSSYNKVYGALAGVIVFLLWLWITNAALLFGAELDAELERGRELQSGVAAEETIQLPARDTRNIDKAENQHVDDVRIGRELRSKDPEHNRDRNRSAADPDE
jgi:membrane protein